MEQKFYDEIKNILITARNKVYQTANFSMVEAYWNIGKSIIEEQGGNEKAEYGTGLLKDYRNKWLKILEKDLLLPIWKIWGSFIWHFQMATHCVANWVGLTPNDDFYESDLEQALITHLQKFLLELGRGFSFVARQKRITFDGRHFRIDLVFYNYILKCFVLIDLKVGDLTHQDLGQMQMYVHYYERELMNEGDNPPIGIVLCADKSESVVKYTLPENETQIFASKYKLYLPSEEELLRELNQEYRALEASKTEEEYIDGMKKE